jgi:serine protease Do
MKGWKVAAVSAALLVAAGVGAALAPAAYGQAAAARRDLFTRVHGPRAFEVFTGGGSRIGVSIREVDESDGKSAKIGAAAGAMVEEVTEESPAEKAGIRKGDLIVEFDGERVRGVRHLTRLVQETPDGRTVQAVVVRDGQRMTLTVTPRDNGVFGFEGYRVLEDLGREFKNNIRVRPAPPAARGKVTPSPWRFDDLLGRGSGRLGITVDTLSPQLAEYFGTKDGVLVTTVNDDSPAAKAGMKAGDVITTVNGSSINDAADLRRRLQDIGEGDEFTIVVMRDRKPQTLKGKLEGTERSRRFRTMA